jgi:putative membrane protein
MTYLWVKTFHIVFVTSWFAGLFYLPRIFVNLAMIAPDSAAERDRLLLMAGKLYRFMRPLMWLALGLGLWLWLGFEVGKGSLWMHLKLVLILILLVYHMACGRILQGFRDQRNHRSHIWFRWFNELPVLVLVAVVALVVIKPMAT